MRAGHDSDCAVHNMPAYPNGPCSCGLEGERLRAALTRITSDEFSLDLEQSDTDIGKDAPKLIGEMRAAAREALKL